MPTLKRLLAGAGGGQGVSISFGCCHAAGIHAELSVPELATSAPVDPKVWRAVPTNEVLATRRLPAVPWKEAQR